MRKKVTAYIMMGVMTLSLLACGKTADQPAVEPEIAPAKDTEDTPQTDGMGNPWRDCTEEEADSFVVNGFSAPEDATNINWSVMEKPSDGSKPMVQLNFDIDDLSFCAREQITGDGEIVDISGMYAEWDVEEDIKLANWRDGLMEGKFYGFKNEDECAQMILWYDVEIGIAYSLSVWEMKGDALDGFDLQAIAEALYAPDKQANQNIPDADDVSEEEEVAPDIDPSGCDTFTQMIDKKLENGMGYANEPVGDTDVFFVSSGTYDNLDGKEAAIDAALFIYGEDEIIEIGKVCAGGTAYPLSLKDKYLYVGCNHEVSKYTVENGELKLVETNSDTLFDELEEAEVIGFATVGGSDN